MRNGTVFVFDPIQSWPGPGFSLGFGRIVYYNGYTDANQVSWHSFMLIEPNGTRLNLGTGTDYGTNSLQRRLAIGSNAVQKENIDWSGLPATTFSPNPNNSFYRQESLARRNHLMILFPLY